MCLKRRVKLFFFFYAAAYPYRCRGVAVGYSLGWGLKADLPELSPLSIQAHVFLYVRTKRSRILVLSRALPHTVDWCKLESKVAIDGKMTRDDNKSNGTIINTRRFRYPVMEISYLLVCHE